MQATFASRCLTARGLLMAQRRGGDDRLHPQFFSPAPPSTFSLLVLRTSRPVSLSALASQVVDAIIIGIACWTLPEPVLISSSTSRDSCQIPLKDLPNSLVHCQMVIALYSTSTGNEVVKQGANQGQAAIVAKERNSGEQVADTKILSTLCEVLNVQVPFMFKLAVDWLTTVTGNASALASFTAANSTALAIFWSPAAVLVGYGIARAGSSAFNELRTAVFSKRTIASQTSVYCLMIGGRGGDVYLGIYWPNN
ncbi:ABC transporter of the mitochondrion 3 [Actinidia rufa]|uniref:ABC transporter of the mitochondrion 3 n=1 Tax=Actinidia rufa TaxID=165716 RepID=A0A7J0DMC3_9ERIC|nr:ABC transporter of the mitochondrion 3 [Actinidia rufa]